MQSLLDKLAKTVEGEMDKIAATMYLSGILGNYYE